MAMGLNETGHDESSVLNQIVFHVNFQWQFSGQNILDQAVF
jgi:hypothetical protein